METKKSKINWWIGLIIAILSALFAYLSSCQTHHSFSINADSIDNPQIHYADSIGVQKPW